MNQHCELARLEQHLAIQRWGLVALSLVWIVFVISNLIGSSTA